MQQTGIILPLLALVGITVIIWMRMYLVRVSHMKRQRIHPQKVATRAQASEALAPCSAPADNFMNLFELPVLFYALVPLLMLTGKVDDSYVVMAWVFVGLRAVHSLIHVSYNKVMHRFWTYCIGGFVLFAMWGRFAWQVVAA